MKIGYRWDYAIIALLFTWMILESSTLFAQDVKQLQDSILHLQAIEKNREAMQVYSLLLEKEPQLASHCYHRAELRKKMHDIRGAISDYSKAITLDSTQTEYFAARGEARWTLRDSKNAISDYTNAIALEPKNADWYMYRGLIKIFSKQEDAGCKDLKKAKRFKSQKAAEYYESYCNKK